jgi:microcystin-dependent protein
MSEQFLGEIRMFGGNFAPQGWSFCDGSLLSIAQNTALFQLVGTTYGGDGESTFALPDLRGRAPRHQGATFIIGQIAGVEAVTLTGNQMPSHSHAVMTAGASQGGPVATPGGSAVLADEVITQPPSAQPHTYLPFDGTNQTSLAPNTIGVAGQSLGHDNMQPFLTVTFIIALVGIFPSQN